MLVFDLDDTLYQERDYVLSGFKKVAEAVDSACADDIAKRLCEWRDAGVVNPFERLLRATSTSLTLSDLKRVYRGHFPKIQLAERTRLFLAQSRAAGHPIGILTDGRSTSQRKKIQALGLHRLADYIVVSEEIGSEKPAAANYQMFERWRPNRAYAYIGDNLRKDFVTPKRLGWTTVGVRDQGNNIHSQNERSVDASHRPEYWVDSIA